jgi:hypothetical protein
VLSPACGEPVEGGGDCDDWRDHRVLQPARRQLVALDLAGHDRCIVPIKPENIDAWLNPDPSNLAAQYAILDDRHQPYYEYRLAA